MPTNKPFPLLAEELIGTASLDKLRDADLVVVPRRYIRRWQGLIRDLGAHLKAQDPEEYQRLWASHNLLKR